MGLEHTVSFKDDQYGLALFIETPCQLLGPGTPRLWGQASQYKPQRDWPRLLGLSSTLEGQTGAPRTLEPSTLTPGSERPVQDRQKTSLERRSRLPSPESVTMEACLEETGLESTGGGCKGGLGLVLLACSWRCTVGRGCLCSGPESFLSSSVHSH